MHNSFFHSIRNIWRQVKAAAFTAARSNMAYSGELFTRTVFMGVILYIFFKLWQATFAQSGSCAISGFTLGDMLWYLVFTESITMSAPRQAQQIDEDVRNGTVALRLLRPMDYPLYSLSTALGDRTARFSVNLFIGSVVCLTMVGPPQYLNGTVPYLAMLSAAVAGAFILDGLATLIIGLLAFWLEDTSGLLLIYSRLSMILGGMLLPIELLPEWLRNIVVLLPFPYLVWGPAHFFVKPDLSGSGQIWPQLMLSQAIWIAILLVVSRLIYSRALGRISVSGG